MKFTSNTFKRAARTFLQAVLAYALVSLKNGVDFTDTDVLKSFAAGLIAAGIAALMNLENGGEKGEGAMSFEEFAGAYLGKGTDYDGAYGVQCVDLAKLYIDKVIGVKPQSIGNAHCYYDDFENTYLKKYFEKIPYKKGVTAKRGDLVVWGKYYNGTSPYGHIALAAGVQDTATITTYDQNWGGSSMKKVVHTLSGISGFLRPLNAEKATCFKACKRGFLSISDALQSIGEKSSYEYRKKIAAANSIKGYKGTAAQNLKMLSLLKKGKLIKPNAG